MKISRIAAGQKCQMPVKDGFKTVTADTGGLMITPDLSDKSGWFLTDSELADFGYQGGTVTTAQQKKRSDLATSLQDDILELLYVKPHSSNTLVRDAIGAVCDQLVQLSELGQGKHGNSDTRWDKRGSLHHWDHLVGHLDAIMGSEENLTEDESGLPHVVHAMMRALMCAVIAEMEGTPQ